MDGKMSVSQFINKKWCATKFALNFIYLLKQLPYIQRILYDKPTNNNIHDLLMWEILMHTAWKKLCRLKKWNKYLPVKSLNFFYENWNYLKSVESVFSDFVPLTINLCSFPHYFPHSQEAIAQDELLASVSEWHRHCTQRDSFPHLQKVHFIYRYVMY